MIEADSTTEIGVGAAIGEAMFPEDGEDAQSLRKCADRGMYQHKFAEREHPAERA